MKKDEKKTWGGARQGAGRKKKDNKVLQVYMGETDMLRLKALSKAHKMPVGEYISNVLLPLVEVN